jgi:hypothetical protein
MFFFSHFPSKITSVFFSHFVYTFSFFRTVESIHGSLLTIGELLRNSGEFMLARFKEVCDTVLKYRDHKDRLVRKTVIELLPLLAAFCPEAFVRGYLSQCMEYLIETLRGGHIRDAAYLALGEMAVAVGSISPLIYFHFILFHYSFSFLNCFCVFNFRCFKIFIFHCFLLLLFFFTIIFRIFWQVVRLFHR